MLLVLWVIGVVLVFINYNFIGVVFVYCVKRVNVWLMFIDFIVVGNVGEDVKFELSGIMFEVVIL